MFPVVPAEYLAPGGLLALVVLLLLFGLLVPRRTLVDSQRRESQWREAYLKERDAHEQTRAQLGEALLQGQVTNRILDSARAAAEEATM